MALNDINTPGKSTVLTLEDVDNKRSPATYSFAIVQYNNLVNYIKKIKKTETDKNNTFDSKNLYVYFIRIHPIKLPISYYNLFEEINNLIVYLNKKAEAQSITDRITFNRTLYTDENLVDIIAWAIVFVQNTLKL